MSSPTAEHDARAKEAFRKLKEICVPLLGFATLTRSNEPRVLALLDSLVSLLKSLSKPHSILTPNLIKYVFMPLSSLLHRNDLQDVPDQILERIFLAFGVLCDTWWWTCDVKTWEQLVMLSGSNLLPPGPRFRKRDDHVKDAATRCLLELMRPRTPSDAPYIPHTPSLFNSPQHIFDTFRNYAQSPKFFPIMGQLVNNVLDSVASSHRSLQLASLQLLDVLVSEYFGTKYSPIILPGVVSSMCKVVHEKKTGASGWQNSEVCSAVLLAMQSAIICSVGDDICAAEGVVRGPASGIEELSDLAGSSDTIIASSPLPDISPSPAPPSNPDPKLSNFVRSTSWLNATASQLHIALNTLTQFTSHPNPKVLRAFASFSATLLGRTRFTLHPSQTLLLSNVLTLSVSSYPDVSSLARESLIDQLESDKDGSIARLVLDMTQTSMNTLPRLIPSHSEVKVQKLASQIEAVCIVAMSSDSPSANTLRASIETLLGPTGQVEKWGFSLFNVLEFSIPSIMPMTTTTQLLETVSIDASTVHFPPLELIQLRSEGRERDAFQSVERMLRALGRAGGEAALYSVEWFVERGTDGCELREGSAALWVAGRLLEGIEGVLLGDEDGLGRDPLQKQGKKTTKTCRWIARSVTEDLDGSEDLVRSDTMTRNEDSNEEREESNIIVEYKKGIDQLQTMIDFSKTLQNDSSPSRSSRTMMRQVHSALSLHLLAITSSILSQSFRSLLLQSLYPVLHSLTSRHAFVAATAQATLRVITSATAYASPAHLLLANFDYALNSCSLHLTRARLDMDATKVLALLVRLVGSEVVERAGDVVEECFDRLDEYHGYHAIVEGLVDVLREVVRAVRTEDVNDGSLGNAGISKVRANEAFDRGEQRLDGFFRWYTHRHDPDPLVPNEEEDFGPVPQTAWGDIEKGKQKDVYNSEEENDEQTTTTGEEESRPLTQLQVLTQQIISRSSYLLTHPSSMIRARILSLLASSIPILKSSESSLLPSIHKAWPFIVNRLSDTEPFVVTEAAGLVESIVLSVGDFMNRRIWNDVWPRFQKMLKQLEIADSKTALVRRRGGNIGTETAYSVSHRTYRRLLGALNGVVKGTELSDALAWEVASMCRRFLSLDAHPEIQAMARELYVGLGRHNSDMVWLVLCGTMGQEPQSVGMDGSGKPDVSGRDETTSSGFPLFLKAERLDILANACVVLDTIR